MEFGNKVNARLKYDFVVGFSRFRPEVGRKKYEKVSKANTQSKRREKSVGWEMYDTKTYDSHKTTIPLRERIK